MSAAAGLCCAGEINAHWGHAKPTKLTPYFSSICHKKNSRDLKDQKSKKKKHDILKFVFFD